MTDCLQEKETIKVPVLDEAGEDVGWKRVESKNGCVVPKDPDAPPKDAVHKYCKLDKLEKMCCSAFRNEVSTSCTMHADLRKLCVLEYTT